MKRAYILALLALVIGVVFLAGCNNNDRIMISKILNRPDKYLDKNVVVAGEVTKSFAVNLFIAEAGAYQVDDGSGKIWVITHNGVPREGSMVGLKGSVEQGVKIGREMFGAVLRERERRIR